MAIVTAVNVTSPNTIAWATAGSDRFVRQTHLAGVTEDFDLHDHAATRGLGVRRVQTAAAPAASGQVQVNVNTWSWWGSGVASVRTAVDVESTQTVTGAKTFSSGIAVAGGVNVTGGATVTAGDLLVSAGAATVSGSVYVGDIAPNAFATGPAVTINQAGSDNEILTLKSSDVNHGMTALTELDSYATFGKISAGAGGLQQAGYASGTTALFLTANHTTDDTTKSSSALGHFLLAGWTKSLATSATPSATANLLALRGGATTRFLFDNAGALYAFGSTANDKIGNGLWFVNAASNANMTTGLTINQGAAANEILAFKSSDVAHGATALAETDTYARFQKSSSTAGGLSISGFAEAGAAQRGVWLLGTCGTGDTTHNTGAVGYVHVTANTISGGTSAVPGADNNLFVVASGAQARFIVDQEGDLFTDSTSGTATTYDALDDLSLCRAFDREVVGRGVVESVFDRFVTHNRADLEALGIVAPDDPVGGHRGLVNTTRLQRLHNGALWQLNITLLAALDRLAALEDRLAAVGG